MGVPKRVVVTGEAINYLIGKGSSIFFKRIKTLSSHRRTKNVQEKDYDGDMKFIILLLLISCGKPKDEERCRGGEEMQMMCQVEWAEEFRSFTIPSWVKNQCQSFYPTPGCYYDSSKRHYW